MDEIFEVAVLGAGLAGLVAARELSAAGYRVALLEARERVGGRTLSRSLPGCAMGVDLGAEWVAPRFHLAMVTELERYGLPMVSPDPVPEHDPAAAVDPAWTALLAQIDQDAGRINPYKPDWYRDVTAFEMPLQQYLQQLGVPMHLQHGLLPHAFALHGAHHGHYSATNLLHDVAAFGGCEQAFHADERRIAGGSQALAQRIAADIGCELRLAWPVTTVSQSGDEVVISGPRGAVRASCAVVAMPVNVLAELDLHLPLPTSARTAIAEGHPGRAAKGWRVAQAVPPIGSCGWPDAIEVYSRQSEATDATAVATFNIAQPDHDKGLERAWSAVAQRHPEIVFTGEALSHDWVADPYARGTWLSAAPGQAAGWHELADAPPPVVFAGGDLSRRWYGWMEGAITSGADAAHRVATYLNSGTVLSASG